jgi:uncharacterized membrane protein
MATETVGKAAGKTVGKAKGAAGGAAGKAKKAVPSSDLGGSLRRLAETVTTRAASTLTDKVTSTTGRLTNYSSGEGNEGGGGLLSAITGNAPGVRRKAMAGGVKGAIGGMFKGIKDKIRGALGGGKGKLKTTNIIEQIDIGAPVDLVYDQWTRFTDFPSFMKKVESVEQLSDEKLLWKVKIFWSQRSWEATILEQVPDERIVWRSKGAKGHVDGAVTFHEITPDLTRVLVVLEYHPRGLFEKTGNIWRAQGRRVRLELKHFRRHLMSHALLNPDDVEGWRGEIRDGEVIDQGDEDAPEDTHEDVEDTDEDTESEEDTEEDTDEAEAEQPADEDEDDREPVEAGRK